MLFKLVVPLFLIFCLRVSAFDGATDQRIRKCLLQVLERFHLKLSPLPVLAPTSRRNGVGDLPFELKVRATSFLDFKSIRRLLSVNQSSRDCAEVSIHFMLHDFDPYFLTSDSLVNKLLFFILAEHFPQSHSRTSPTFQDELELLTLKFNFEPESFSKIPRNILYYFLCLFHEMSYGLDSPVPTDKSLGRVHFIRQLRLNNLPTSYYYYINNAIDPMHPEQVYYVRMFESKPDSEKLKSIFGIQIVSYASIVRLNLREEFQVAIIETLFAEFPVSDLNILVIYLCNFNSYSNVVDDKVTIYSEYVRSRDFRFLKAKNLNIKRAFPLCDHIAWFQQIYTADSINHFSLEALAALEQDFVIFEIGTTISRVQSLSLANLEMLSQLVNSEFFIDSLDLAIAFEKAFQSANRLLFELLVKESNRPLCAFYRIDKGCIHSSLQSKFFDEKMSIEFLKLFADLIQSQSRDPFVFLLMREEVLLALKPFIQDKFILDLNYQLDFKSDELLRISPLFGPQFEILHKSGVFCFKDVLNLLDRSDIKQVFSSDLSAYSKRKTDAQFETVLIDENFALFSR